MKVTRQEITYSETLSSNSVDLAKELAETSVEVLGAGFVAHKLDVSLESSTAKEWGEVLDRLANAPVVNSQEGTALAIEVIRVIAQSVGGTAVVNFGEQV